jgi:hypothetical protein
MKVSLQWHIVHGALIGRESRSMYQDKKNSFFKLQQDAFGYMAWGETMELMAMGKKMLSIYDHIDKHTQPNVMTCNHNTIQ